MFIVGGGYTEPNAEVSDHLGDGYNFNIGVQVKVDAGLRDRGALQLQRSRRQADHHSRVADTGDAAARRPTSSPHEHAVRDGQPHPAGAEWRGQALRPRSGWASTTGRSRSAPRLSATCRATAIRGGMSAIPADSSRSRTSLASAARRTSAWCSAAASTSAPFYAELRYHYIWGPTVEERRRLAPIAGGDTISDRKANGQFLAVSFGFRF